MKPEYITATEEDLDQAMKALKDLLDILGWVVRQPETENADGLIIGTPEFIEAWDERTMKRKEDLQ